MQSLAMRRKLGFGGMFVEWSYPLVMKNVWNTAFLVGQVGHFPEFFVLGILGMEHDWYAWLILVDSLILNFRSVSGRRWYETMVWYMIIWWYMAQTDVVSGNFLQLANWKPWPMKLDDLLMTYGYFSYVQFPKTRERIEASWLSSWWLAQLISWIEVIILLHRTPWSFDPGFFPSRSHDFAQSPLFSQRRVSSSQRVFQSLWDFCIETIWNPKIQVLANQRNQNEQHSMWFKQW